MILEIKDLTKEYKRGKDGFDAVNGVNLSIEEGDFVSIIGHSGCGKTTLFNMMAGLIRPSSGSIMVAGEDITKKSEEELAKYRNQTIGYALQGQSLLANFSIMDNICMPAYLASNRKNVHKRAQELLEMMGLKGMEKEKPANLSGGELRRVSILRAVINEPAIIIADEPTSSLDPDNAKMIMDFFKKMNQQGITVIVSTHDLEFLSYTKKNYKMEQGRL